MNSPASTVSVWLFVSAVTVAAGDPGMVFIPGGHYTRGRVFEWPDTQLKWYPNPLKDDLPARSVSVSPFYLDQSEVTNEQYARFVQAAKHPTPYHWIKGAIPAGQEKHPVVNVSWDDAAAYCKWDDKRLPTEAEWERAARGLAEGRMYPWGDAAPTQKLARFDAEGTAPVCATEKNYFGLCDMIGNVWEWTSDWYDRDYYKTSPDRDPKGPSSGLYRVLRGGSWFDQPPLFLSVSYRSWARAKERSQTIGFRCAKSFGSKE